MEEISTFFARLVASHHVLTFLIIFLTISTITTSACSNNCTNIPNSKSTTTIYIKTSCNSTTYPSICYKSLSPYASKIESDPLKLSNFSLTLAYKAAKSASSNISKLLKRSNLTETAEQVVQDCVDYFKDSIGQLKDSLDAMGHLDGTDSYRKFQISNMKTWVSATITNEQTCLDECDEMNLDSALRKKIRKVVLDVARMTSNALYFINNLIY